MQQIFDGLEGVLEVICGYTGGYIKSPTYRRVSSGRTGHYEAVKITFDTDKISYTKLLKIFLENIEPTNCEGQFSDTGNQYRLAIFYTNEQQKKTAECWIDKLEKALGKTPCISIKKAQEFYKAEEEHQYYYKKHPIEYRIYHNTSGRDSMKKLMEQLIESISTPDRC